MATAILLWSQVAAAAAPGAGATFENNPINYPPPKTERRGGFAMALSSGYGAGSYVGYPLEVAALNDPSQRASTGVGLATHFSMWLGGALRDWLATGIGIALLSNSGQARGTTAAFIFHAEAYPLYAYGGQFKNLGLAFDGGIGASLLYENSDKSFEDPIAEGGAMSNLGLSVFWEPLRFWNFSAGPILTYNKAFSQSMQVNQVTLGFRTALYGVQPKKKNRRKKREKSSSRGSS